MSFRCSNLWSLLPFRSTFFCSCPSFPLFSSWFSLSLHWPFFLTPIASSVSPCFRFLLLQSVACSDLYFSLVAGSPVGFCLFSFSLRLHVLLWLFVCLWYAVSSFFFFALCPGSSPFLPLFKWVPSVISVGGGRSLPLFCFPYRSTFLSFEVFRPCCPLPFFPLPPWGASWFPSLVPDFHLPGVSSLVRCLFPLGSFGFRASSFVSGLFRWALLWLSCLSSRLVCFAVGLFLSLLVPGSSFLLLFSLRLMLLVPSFTPLARWSSFWCLAAARLVRDLRAVSRVYSVVLLSPLPVFRVFRAMPVSSFTLLPRSLGTLLGAFVGVLPGLLCCVLSVLGIFLLLVLMLFLPVLVRFCFSSFSFSDFFWGGSLFLCVLSRASSSSSSASAGGSSSSSAPAFSAFHAHSVRGFAASGFFFA